MNKAAQGRLRKIYGKKDVFEQDVGTIKVTRVLDPVPQNVSPETLGNNCNT